MKRPTMQQYRLAAWKRLLTEKREKADEWREKAIRNDINGFYSRAESAQARSDTYRQEADGMLSALYALGFSETEVETACAYIEEYQKS